MSNCKPELMKVFAELTPENQRTLILCARTACAAEKAARVSDGENSNYSPRARYFMSY